MTKGQLGFAKRKALENFDKWNEVTGLVAVNSGYYGEIVSLIEDAVCIGSQMAIFGNIKKDEQGNVVQERFE